MKQFMDWLTDVFAPASKKFFSRPYIGAVSSSMQKILPFILTGSVIYCYNVFRAYIPALPDLGRIIDFSFKMLSLIVAFMIAHQLMEKLDLMHYSVNAGITSVLTFIMFIVPNFSEGAGVISFTYERLGPTGMFVGIIAGLFVGFVYHMFSRLQLLKNNVSVPDFIIEWINNIIPILICISISMVVIFKLEIDIFQIIINLFMPIQNFAQTLPGLMLLSFIQAFFFSLGISPWVWGAIRNPIFAVAIAANIAAVAAGENPLYITTYETMFAIGLLTLGGQGAPLPLNFMMLFSKSRKLKTLGRVCIGPSIFNISEPLMFGVPIVFNPILMVPCWINSLVGALFVWIVMKGGLLSIPSMSLNVGQIPAPISTVLITQDFRGIIWYAVLFIIYAAIWYPFFKVYERSLVAEEGK